jgi:uncharacterized protein
MRLQIGGLKRALGEGEEVLRERAAKVLGLEPGAIAELELLKRSMDARKRPVFIYQVEVELAPGVRLKRLPDGVEEAPDPALRAPRQFTPRKKERIVVIGAGPAGLFCAWRLANSGVEVILVDRGQPVEIRAKDVSALMHKGDLNPESNICFGEGGAGTWSDGKLYTRVRDVRVRHILETIVALGGPDKILIDAKPHLGTDKLVALCKAFRRELTARGCEVRFGAFVEDLIIEDGASGAVVKGIVLRGGDRVEADRVVMAVGHSAREMYRWLAEREVAMEPKPFAVGFRVEHPQALINEIQYGQWATTEGIPTADYRLAANYGEGDEHRGVYSFCMCPGGQVVPSSSFEGGVCINGMSHASRKGHWANSALVVSVKPEDFGSFGADTPGLDDFGGILAGMAFQEEAERRAYELGGGGYIAPAQRLTDFKARKVSTGELRKTTYKPGVASAVLDKCYPAFVNDHLRQALGAFNRTLPGFLMDEAVLIGVETRTSAPVQVTRHDDSLQSVSLAGLYPSGEGAGYGGGIVSAALDGLRVAERILEELSV